MQRRAWPLLLALLLAVSCAPPPLSIAPSATTPAAADVTSAPTAAATSAPTVAGTAATPIAPPTLTGTATPTAGAANGWQTYTNASVPLTISYPPGWTVEEQTAEVEAVRPLRDIALDGPEGEVYLQWGTGFSAFCARYSALHLANGQVSACHWVQEDGTYHWGQIYGDVGAVQFAGSARTKNADPSSADTVLAILATLSFDAAGVFHAPDQAEAIVDNAGPDFWPVGNWYVLDAEQRNGPDCYEALPGLQSYADIRPNLAQAGLYEVSAWWCGNPHLDQTNRGTIEVHRALQDAAPQAVQVNYQEGAGQWQSLGVYELQPGAFLRVRSAIDGNVPADAYRFVALTGEGASGGEVLPTPLPTGPLVSNNPPSPLQQVTSGDLVTRLGMTDIFYSSVTMTSTQRTFDDCRAFPREGCTGTRDGWQALVSHQGIMLTYQVAGDYKLVAIEGLEALDPTTMGQARPQRVFMRGSGGGIDFRLLYYPDNTWHLLRWPSLVMPADDMLLSQEQVAVVQALIPKYGTLYLDQPQGGSLVFYGLGSSAGPSAEDRKALLGLGVAFAGLPAQ